MAYLISIGSTVCSDCALATTTTVVIILIDTHSPTREARRPRKPMALIKIANLILYYRKYGLGRNGGPTRSLSEAFGVVRNVWIYTKEFMMPKKL